MLIMLELNLIYLDLHGIQHQLGWNFGRKVALVAGSSHSKLSHHSCDPSIYLDLVFPEFESNGNLFRLEQLTTVMDLNEEKDKTLGWILLRFGK